jgi:protein-S-isoprenylcysteine O-methyltransferase Ste14
MHRFLPPTYFAIFLVLGVALGLFFPLLRYLHWPYQLVGILPFVFGAIITIHTDSMFKKRKTTVKPHLSPTTFISDGPFKICRHPMYLGMTSLLFGIALLVGTLTALIAPVGFGLLMDRSFIPLEERSMVEQFGDQYTRYRKTVRRWI